MRRAFNKLVAMLSAAAITAGIAVMPAGAADDGKTIDLSVSGADNYKASDGYCVYRAEITGGSGAYYLINDIDVPSDVTVKIYLLPSEAGPDDWGSAVMLQYTNGEKTNSAAYDPTQHYRAININNDGNSGFDTDKFTDKAAAIAYSIANITIYGELVSASQPTTVPTIVPTTVPDYPDGPGGDRLTGTPFGTPAWNNGGNTYDKAFDGKPALGDTSNTNVTIFDAGDDTNGYTGIELDKPRRITGIMYYPRQEILWRMDGSVFEGSNDGKNYIPIYTVPQISGWEYTKTNTWYTVGIEDLAIVEEFKYLRLRCPHSNCNVAEIAFFADDTIPYTQLSLSVDGKRIDSETYTFTPGEHTITVQCKTDKKDGELTLELKRNGGETEIYKSSENVGEGLAQYVIEHEFSAEEYYTGFEIDTYYTYDGEKVAEKKVREKLYSIEKGDAGLFESGDEIGFIGDSITHSVQHNLMPFEDLIYEYYITHYPEKDIIIRNLGVAAATTATTLKGVSPEYPDYSALDYYFEEYPNMNKVAVMLGMNDITANSDDQQQAYDDNMRALVGKLLDADKEVILITPSIWDQTKGVTEPGDEWGKNDGLVIASETVRQIADDFSLPVVEFNSTMLEVNSIFQTDNINSSIIDEDQAHPGNRGYSVMQYLFLRQQGAGGDRTVLSVSNAQNATVSDAVQYKNFVSFNYKLDSLPMAYTDGYRQMEEYIGFEKDLNSQIVIANNLAEGTYELKIDGASLGKYTSAELALGVNIAENEANPSQKASMEIHNQLLENKHAAEAELQTDVRYRMLKDFAYPVSDADKTRYKQSVADAIESAYAAAQAEVNTVHTLTLSRTDSEEGLMLSNVFSDNMVLQQGNSVIYGKGESGVTYTATIKNNDAEYTASAKAENGAFKITMTDTVASDKPFVLTVQSDDELVMVYNVYIGDVYLLGGQSNMEQAIENAETHYWGQDAALNKIRADLDEIKNKNGSKIHFITQDQYSTSYTPFFDAPIHTSLSNPWNTLNNDTERYISILGTYFANELINEEELDYPIGLIVGSRGGTYISEWLPNSDGKYYNTHIAPFVGFGISGILWYQGENDSNNNSADLRRYANSTTQLINDYRKMWNDDDLPFVYMQLSVHGGNNLGSEDNPNEAYYTTRNEQRTILDKVGNKKNVGMIVTLDTASRPLVGGVHPDGKDEVGHRAANAIRGMVYNREGLTYSGPLYDGFIDNGNGTVTVKFKGNTKDMYLKSTNEEDKAFFAVAGADKKYVKCSAEVVNNTVVLTPESAVSGNVYYVKYAMTNQPVLTLFSGDNLPASPFESEDRVTITAIGDSITEGIGVYGAWTRGYGSYPMIAQDTMNSMPELGKSYYVENRGYGGWCLMNNTDTPYMLGNDGEVWRWARGDRSDIYTIALGTNDSNENYIPDVESGVFEKDYMEMIDGIKEYYSGAEIYICVPVPALGTELRWDGKTIEDRIKIVREKIYSVYETAKAKYGDSIKLIDFFEGFTKVINSDEPYEPAAAQSRYSNTQSSDFADWSETSFNEYGTPNGKYLFDNNLGSGSNQIKLDSLHPGQAGARLLAQLYVDAITYDDIPQKPSITVSDKEITVSGRTNGTVYSVVYGENGILTGVERFEVTEDNTSFEFKQKPDVVYWWTNNMSPIAKIDSRK